MKLSEIKNLSSPRRKKKKVTSPRQKKKKVTSPRKKKTRKSMLAPSGNLNAADSGKQLITNKDGQGLEADYVTAFVFRRGEMFKLAPIPGVTDDSGADTAVVLYNTFEYIMVQSNNNDLYYLIKRDDLDDAPAAAGAPSGAAAAGTPAGARSGAAAAGASSGAADPGRSAGGASTGDSYLEFEKKDKIRLKFDLRTKKKGDLAEVKDKSGSGRTAIYKIQFNDRNIFEKVKASELEYVEEPAMGGFGDLFGGGARSGGGARGDVNSSALLGAAGYLLQTGRQGDHAIALQLLARGSVPQGGRADPSQAARLDPVLARDPVVSARAPQAPVEASPKPRDKDKVVSGNKTDLVTRGAVTTRFNVIKKPD